MAKRSAFPAAITLLLMLIVALTMLNFSDIGKRRTWDIEIPMTNTNISWEQTYFPGAFEMKGENNNG